MKLISLINSDKLVKVSDEDFEYLNQWKWRLSNPARNKWYAQTGKKVLMHRVILGLTDPNIWGDHLDSDGLNNQRENLRTCSKIENGYNVRKSCGRNGKPHSSIYKGVSFCKKTGKWKVSITAKDSINNPNSKEGNRIFIGLFDEEISAGIAYNHSATKYHRNFAKVNDIPNWENIIPVISHHGKSSDYYGVWFNTLTNCWVANIKNDLTGEERRKNFDLELHAGIYFNIHNQKLNGDNGKLNDIEDWEQIIPIPRAPDRKYKGLSKNRFGNWRVTVVVNKIHHHMGTFKEEKEAARVYNESAIKLLGDKAKLNIIEK